MKIYVVGSSKNKFLPLNNIREKFLIDQPHEGDNIDFLNPWYCELTGLYWIWKNSTEDIVGLEHYRRYFVNDKNQLLSENEIKNILKNYDCIMMKVNCKGSEPIKYLKGNKVTSNFYNKFCTYIKDNNFRCWYLNKIKTATIFRACNMFIANKNIINKYMDWLFDILITIPSKEFFYKPRVIGYMAEFIFGYWLEYNNYKITYADVNCFNKNITRLELKRKK